MNTLLLTDDECEAVLNALYYNALDKNLTDETREEWKGAYLSMRDKMFAQGYYHPLHTNPSSKPIYRNVPNI